MDEYKYLSGLIYAKIWNPLLTGMRDRIVKLSKKYDFSNILDIGCGIGTLCIMLDKHGFKVTGVDMSETMVKGAIQNSSSKIEYYHEDACNLHFPDQSFDCIILSYMLHEADPESRNKIIKEAERLLQKGGKIIIVDFAHPLYSKSLIVKLFSSLGMFVELYGGRRHWKNYTDFIKKGALNKIKSDFNLFVIERDNCSLGLAEIIVAEFPNNKEAKAKPTEDHYYGLFELLSEFREVMGGKCSLGKT